MAALLSPAGPLIDIVIPSPASLVSAIKQKATEGLPSLTIKTGPILPSTDSFIRSVRGGLSSSPSPSVHSHNGEQGLAFAGNGAPRIPIFSNLMDAMGFNQQPPKDSNVYCGPYGIEVF